MVMNNRAETKEWQIDIVEQVLRDCLVFSLISSHFCRNALNV